MNDNEAKRKAKRKELLHEIKVRFPGQENYISLVVKDLSATGLRIVVTRLVKMGDLLEIRMCINGRDIQCKAKVAWSLLLSPCMGSISPFNVGLEFCEIDQEDRAFLEKITGEQK